MLTPFAFLLILSLLVFVHEAGHFLMAKRAGILVEEFGFGLPPRLFGFKKGETIYSLNALPFGGFVRLYGENGADQHQIKKSPSLRRRAFFAQKPRWKAAVILSGVIMNFFLAVIVFSIAYSLSGIPTETNQVTIFEVSTDSPAQAAGLQPGDKILTVESLDQSPQKSKSEEMAPDAVSQSGNLVHIKSTADFLAFIDQHRGDLIALHVKRTSAGDSSESLTIRLVPRKKPPAGQGSLGVTVSTVEMKFFPWWQMSVRGAIEGLREAAAWGKLVVEMLVFTLVRLITRGEVAEGLAGPIEIYRLTGQVIQFGAVAILRFLGILSVNLAVVNILPLPALDGGRLVFVIIEAIKGKRPDPSVERVINTIGMTLLVALLLLITLNDLVRIFGSEAIFSKLQYLLPM